MLEQLFQFDLFIFEIIHSDWSNAIFDQILPVMRNKLVWIPFYLFIIVWAFMRMSFKSASYYILAIISLILITDFVSSTVIKKTIKRERPCQIDSSPINVQELVPCGVGYSFPSSHAANHFALAFFLIFSLGIRFKRIKIPLMLWASIISIAQVYVGLHYPSDIIAGFIVGFCLAYLTWHLYKTLILKKNPLY